MTSAPIRSSWPVYMYYLVMCSMLFVIVVLGVRAGIRDGGVGNLLILLALTVFSGVLWRLLGRSCSLGAGDTIRVRGFWRTYVVSWNAVDAVLFVAPDWRTREFNWSWVLVPFVDARGGKHSVVVSANGRMMVSEQKARTLANRSPFPVGVREQERPIPGHSEFIQFALRLVRGSNAGGRT